MMSIHGFVRRGLLIAVGAVSAGSCSSDSGTNPPPPPVPGPPIKLRVFSDLAGYFSTRMVVNVGGPDTSFADTLFAVTHVIDQTIEVPQGAHRVLSLVAKDDYYQSDDYSGATSFEPLDAAHSSIGVSLYPVMAAVGIVHVSVGTTVLEVRPAMASLSVGSTVQLSGQVVDTAGHVVDVPVTWTSEDSGIVSIDKNGLATARAPGYSLITAAAGALTGYSELASLDTIPPTKDVWPPTLEDFRIAPTTVNVGTDSAQVMLTFAASDSGSGMDSVAMTFRDSAATLRRSCSAHAPSTGTNASGTWTCSFFVPQHGPTGIWNVEAGILRDRAGNALTLIPGYRGLPGDTHFVVVDTIADTIPPVLTSFALPDTVDVSLDSASVIAHFTATDQGSGLGWILLTLSDSANDRKIDCSSDGPDYLLPPSGTWTCHTIIRPDYLGGGWSASVRVYDRTGNVRVLNAADLAASGFPSMLYVKK